MLPRPVYRWRRALQGDKIAAGPSVLSAQTDRSFEGGARRVTAANLGTKQSGIVSLPGIKRRRRKQKASWADTGWSLEILRPGREIAN